MRDFNLPICVTGEEFDAGTADPRVFVESEDIAVITDWHPSKCTGISVGVGPFRKTARADSFMADTIMLDEGDVAIKASGYVTVGSYITVGSGAGLNFVTAPLNDHDRFAYQLETWRPRLELANYQTIKRYLRTLLIDQDLEADGVTPSPESFSQFLDFFARHPEYRVSILSLSDRGDFCATWINQRKATRVTLEFIRTGQVKWIYANREKKRKPIAGAGLQQPDSIPQILGAHSATEMVKESRF